MLAKRNRLSKRQFDAFFAKGKRFHFPHCTIIYTPHPEFHGSVVVGKKVTKRAVKRNTIRRRVYAQLYQQLKTNNQVGVFIVIVKPSYLTLTRGQAAATIADNIATVKKST